MTEQKSLPKSFNKAYRFVNYSIAVGVIKLLIYKFVFGLNPMMEVGHAGGIILILSIVYVLGYFAGKARNWARIALLILFILGLFFLPMVFLWELSHSILIVLCSLLQTLFQGYALFLLFSGESKMWIKEQARLKLESEIPSEYKQDKN